MTRRQTIALGVAACSIIRDRDGWHQNDGYCGDCIKTARKIVEWTLRNIKPEPGDRDYRPTVTLTFRNVARANLVIGMIPVP